MRRLETPQQVMAYIESQTMPIPECGCMVWMATLNCKGYGRIQVNKRNRPAHRVAYEIKNGPVPDDLHLDHLCRVRSCCNPDHLEPVTCRENVLRGVGRSAINAKKTHCPRGHPLTPGNLLSHSAARGARSCKKCKAEKRAEMLDARRPNRYRRHNQVPPEVIDSVRELLAQGVSERKIAMHLNVGRLLVARARAVILSVMGK